MYDSLCSDNGYNVLFQYCEVGAKHFDYIIPMKRFSLLSEKPTFAILTTIRLHRFHSPPMDLRMFSV